MNKEKINPEWYQLYSVPENHLFKFHFDEKLNDFFFGVECYPELRG